MRMYPPGLPSNGTQRNVESALPADAPVTSEAGKLRDHPSAPERKVVLPASTVLAGPGPRESSAKLSTPADSPNRLSPTITSTRSTFESTLAKLTSPAMRFHHCDCSAAV